MNDLFSSPDFAWSIRMRRDAPGAFFEKQDTSNSLIERRRHWLDRAPELCVALAESGKKLVEETWALADGWGQLESSCDKTLESIGRNWEADFLLLDGKTLELAGGCVCFPSSWSLQESTGKTLDQVHGVVPRLNEQIGEKITRFLTKLPEGQTFLRENWGLTRTAHLNYHPELKRARLDAPSPLEDVFLRIEHQAFVCLPSGVLMGIRIEPVSLQRVIEVAPETARRLADQLVTMPIEVSRYKGLEAACRWLPDALRRGLS